MYRLDVITFIYYFPKNNEKRNDKNGTLMRYQIILKAFATSYKLIVSEMKEI